MSAPPNLAQRLVEKVRQLARNDILILSILAMVAGASVGGAVILFREGILLLQLAFYGSDTERLWLHADPLPWYHLVLAPAAGGLIVGLLVHYFLPGRRPHSVADAIEASALQAGRISWKTGVWAAVVSATSIGSGASVGREGPAVHLGAVLGSWIAERLHLTRTLSLTLLGCGVAAAVAASFNAPIAGALFANEVVIGHYALRSLAPVVMASVVATVVSRAHFGNFPAFAVPHHEIFSIWEYPAILTLGILAGLLAILFIKGVKLARSVADRLPGPPWLRPAIAGIIVGLIAIPLPHVLGVGYGVTEAALENKLALDMLVLVCAAKLVATTISIGFGFGGGVFSPSLVIGVTFGAAFGIVATEVFPDISAGSDAYAVIGMGAMAAAILGAPISTTLIVFEMTGDYQITMAVMVAVVLSTVVNRQLHGLSFFTWQLEQRGLDLHGGFQTALLRGIRVGDVMSPDCEVIGPEVGLRDLRLRLHRAPGGELFVVDADGKLVGTVSLADLSDAAYDPILDDLVNVQDVARRNPPTLTVDDHLEQALSVTRQSGEHRIAVVRDPEDRQFAGCLYDRDALTAYNRALLDLRREERG